MNNPTYQEQIESHRRSIAVLSEKANRLESAYGRKAALYDRATIAACESCIRACMRRIRRYEEGKV